MDSSEKPAINLLKSMEDVPKWLDEIFNSKNYKERMQALKKINQESLQVDVEKN